MQAPKIPLEKFFTVTISNILGGISPTQYFASAGQYESALGIDPDMPVTDTSVRTSGLLRPTVMSKFSSSGLSGTPLWLVTNPKNSNIYEYASDGELISYSSSLGSETVIGTPTSGVGNGMEYYDNYVYLATPTDISRYGPLDGSPAIANTYWTSTLSKTALVNTTYPAINGVTLPNHPLKYDATFHRMYIGDVVGGKGTIHYIKTTKSSVEGDTDNGSTYAALTTTPYGYLPTCIERYGAQVAAGWIQGTNTTTLGKNAVITFWDGAASAPTNTIDRELPDPFITAMKNVNGVLYCWLGNAQGGCRLIKFAGGYSFQEVGFWEDVYPPLPGAVDHWMNRIIFGSNSTYPSASACVYSVGSKNAQLNMMSTTPPIHVPFKTTSAGSSPMATCLKYVLHADNKIRIPIVGWKDGSTQGIDKVTTGGGVSVWRSQVYRIGAPFVLEKIRIPMAQAMGANMTIIPTIYIDNQTSSTALQTINNTNYPNSDKNIAQNMSVNGKHDFQLELAWSGSALATISLPITMEGTVFTDSLK